VTNRLTALTDIGGVNSIRSFTRSWQRAAGFSEVIPQRPSFIFAPDQVPIAQPPPDADTTTTGDVSPYSQQQRDIERGSGGSGTSPSLIRQHLEAALRAGEQHPPRLDSPEPGASHGSLALLHRTSSRDSREGKPLDDGSDTADLLPRIFRIGSHTTTGSTAAGGGGSIFAIPPHLATPPLVGSYRSLVSGLDYGTVRSDGGGEGGGGDMAHAAALWRQQQEAGGNVPDGELPPILVKEVEQDGKFVLAVEGQSTLPQTVFNSTKYV
jgi:vesicular inhibitory amino acid transporter